MDYHDPVDPVPNETCNGMIVADVLAQEFISAPAHMLDNNPEIGNVCALNFVRSRKNKGPSRTHSSLSSMSSRRRWSCCFGRRIPAQQSRHPTRFVAFCCSRILPTTSPWQSLTSR